MHIPDGFLSAEVAAGAGVVAVAAVGAGLRHAGRMPDERQVPLLGVTAAFVFAAQMVNFPIAGGTSGHLLGAALATILLGARLACLVLAVVLAVQALVFADGGLTALGANVTCMAVVGVTGAALALRAGTVVLPPRHGPFLALAGVVAWLAVMASSGVTAVLLAVSGTVPLGTVLPAMLGVHALIGVGEAVITVAAVRAVLAARPDLPAAAAHLEPEPPTGVRGVPA